MEWAVVRKVESGDEKTIVQGMMEYNRPFFDQADTSDIGVFAKDETGRILAGLTGYTHGEWMFVKWLWVSEELRGQGVGSSLLKRAEEEARARGCRHSMLDTYEFQAPGFYKKYGYTERMVLTEHPATGRHYFLTKDW